MPEDSLAVVQSVLQTTTLPAPLLQTLITKAGGNPFFLEELAWTVREQEPHPEVLGLPETIQTVLAARLDRLPPAAKRLLQTAAVIGTEVAVPLLQAVAELPTEALDQALAHLQEAECLTEMHLVPERRYTFKHVLLQEVAYQSLLRSTRQQLHRHIAQVLERQFPETGATQPELLAQHYTEAGQPAQAIPYWQRAGQRALERSAPAEAISHLTPGLALLTTLAETPEGVQHEVVLQTTLGSALIATRLLRVLQPAVAAFSSFESIHSRAISHPWALSAVTHGTMEERMGSWVALASQCCKSAFVIFLSSAIRPARYMAS